MSAVAIARVANPLGREEALEIINAMPYLVCSSSRKLLRMQFEKRPANHISRVPEIPVYEICLEVFNRQGRSYVFGKQPCRIIRTITREEFERVAPWAFAPRNEYLYEIHTD